MHVTHRGVNRAAVFLDDVDFALYRSLMGQALAREGVALHAYVLMTNHVHLLLTPGRERALSRAMSWLGKGYVPSFNRRHGRTGTLWEGRFRSCLVDSDGYLLTVYRYVELNPVRAAMVERPEDYPWSSVHANLGTVVDPLVTPHAVLESMGACASGGAAWYRDWLRGGVAADDLAAIRTHVRQERAYGSLRFQAMVAATLNRPVAVRPVGRPKSPAAPIGAAAAEGFKR